MKVLLRDNSVLTRIGTIQTKLDNVSIKAQEKVIEHQVLSKGVYGQNFGKPEHFVFKDTFTKSFLGRRSFSSSEKNVIRDIPKKYRT